VLVHGKDAGSSTFSLEAMALENGACGDLVRVRVAVTGALAEMSVLGSGVGILSDKAAVWR
jgi:flagella basal body P-ring formation protein FlgA